MKRFFKAAIAFIISAALFIPQMTAAVFANPTSGNTADENKMSVINYQITNTSGGFISTIPAGTSFNIVVKVNGAADASDVVKPVDSFRCNGEPVGTMDGGTAVLTFTNCYWAGGDKSFGFRLNGNDLTFNLSECQEAPADDPSQSEPSSAEPMFKINTKDISTIKAGENGYFTVKPENLSSIKISKILAEITAPNDVIITDNTDSQEVRQYPNDFEFTVRYKALDKITSAKQSFTINLRYYYTNGNAETIGTATATVNVPAEVTEEAAASGDPVIKITGQSLNNPIAAKSEYDYTLTLRNHGDVDVKDVYVALEGSDAIYFTNGTENGHIDSIPAGKTADLKVKLHTTDNITAIKQSVSATMTYSYTSGGVKKSGESTGNVTVIAKVSEDVAASGGSAPTIV